MAGDSAATILVVDDEPDILTSHARLLGVGLPGVNVITAANGEEALSAMGQHDVDIVLSDLQMPGMDGMQLLHECQRLAPDVYRVIITAFPDAAEAHEAKDAAQLEAILAKPVDPPNLFAMLKGLLDERREMGV